MHWNECVENKSGRKFIENCILKEKMFRNKRDIFVYVMKRKVGKIFCFLKT